MKKLLNFLKWEWKILKESWPYHEPNIFSLLIRRYRDRKISKQSAATLDRVSYMVGLYRKTEETDAELRERIKASMVQPAAMFTIHNLINRMIDIPGGPRAYVEEYGMYLTIIIYAHRKLLNKIKEVVEPMRPAGIWVQYKPMSHDELKEKTNGHRFLFVNINHSTPPGWDKER